MEWSQASWDRYLVFYRYKVLDELDSTLGWYKKIIYNLQQQPVNQGRNLSSNGNKEFAYFYTKTANNIYNYYPLHKLRQIPLQMLNSILITV